MSDTGVLQAGWSLAANDEGAPAHKGGVAPVDPATIALICASRMGGRGFEVLAAPGCLVPLARDGRGIFHFARARA